MTVWYWIGAVVVIAIALFAALFAISKRYGHTDAKQLYAPGKKSARPKK